MLKSLRLINFRCFDDHKVIFEPLTILVGQNNAGKTTISEALRIISLVIARHRNLPYKEPSISIPKRLIGCSPSLKNLQINFDMLFHRYSEPPACLIAEFYNGTSIEVYLDSDGKTHATILDENSKLVRNKKAAEKLKIPTVSILPQVAPVLRNERVLDPDYVKSSMSSHLSPLHFRNQLYLADENDLTEFKNSVEETWPGLRIHEIDVIKSFQYEKEINLRIRDNDFVAEISAMGHGLQMWMQTMWFLARSRNSDTVILDEPDIYMHADLQRRLIRYLKNRFKQIIITTHSTEIMTEVEPSNIVVVNRNNNESKKVNSLPAVQKIVDTVGSVHNINLAKIWNAKKFLIFEGDDIKYLKILYDTVYPDINYPLDSIPNMSIPGWGAWSHVIGSSEFLKNYAGERIHVHCVFDSDYHTPQQITQRYDDACRFKIGLHIWEQKEIENYFLIPSLLTRFINKNCSNLLNVDKKTVSNKINEFAEELRDCAFDNYSQEFLNENRKMGNKYANQNAREIIKSKKEKFGLKGVVSGKKLVSKISGWAQSEFSISISALSIAREMHISEIDDEIKSVLNEINK